MINRPYHLLPIAERYSIAELDHQEKIYLANLPRKGNDLPLPSKDLKLSVVVPMFNEERCIISLLRCMETQKLPADLFELLIVDNGSRDQSAYEVTRYARNSRIKIYLIEEPEKGCLRAIRTGMDVAVNRFRQISPSNNGWISSLDSDDQVGPEWANEMLATCQSQRADFLRGTTTLLNQLPANIESLVKLLCDVENRVYGYAELLRLRFEEALLMTNKWSYPRWFPRITGPNFSISRAAYIAAQGLDPRPPGDQSSHLANPLLRQGGIAIQIFNPKTILYRSNRESTRNYEEAAGYGVGFGIGFGDMLRRARYHNLTKKEIDFPNPILIEKGFNSVIEDFLSENETRRKAARRFMLDYIESPSDPTKLFNVAKTETNPSRLLISKTKPLLQEMTSRLRGLDYRVEERLFQGREHLRQTILVHNQRDWNVKQIISELNYRVKQSNSEMPEHIAATMKMLHALPPMDLASWYNAACNEMERIYSQLCLNDEM